MTAIAATTGTIRSRVDGTLALTIEFSPADAQAAFRLFGTPGTQLGVAALKDGSFLEQSATVDHLPDEPVQHQPKPLINNGKAASTTMVEHQPKEAAPKIGDACLLACRWCADPQFWEWCGAVDAESAKAFICRVCVVSTRKHLDEIPAALERWNEIVRKPYRDYLIKKGIA